MVNQIHPFPPQLQRNKPADLSNNPYFQPRKYLFIHIYIQKA